MSWIKKFTHFNEWWWSYGFAPVLLSYSQSLLNLHSCIIKFCITTLFLTTVSSCNSVIHQEVTFSLIERSWKNEQNCIFSSHHPCLALIHWYHLFVIYFFTYTSLEMESTHIAIYDYSITPPSLEGSFHSTNKDHQTRHPKYQEYLSTIVAK